MQQQLNKKQAPMRVPGCQCQMQGIDRKQMETPFSWTKELHRRIQENLKTEKAWRRCKSAIVLFCNANENKLFCE